MLRDVYMGLMMTGSRRNMWQVLMVRKVMVVPAGKFVVFIVIEHNVMSKLKRVIIVRRKVKI